MEKLDACGTAGVVKKDPFICSRGKGPAVVDVVLEEEEEERHLDAL